MTKLAIAIIVAAFIVGGAILFADFHHASSHSSCYGGDPFSDACSNAP